MTGREFLLSSSTGLSGLSHLGSESVAAKERGSDPSSEVAEDLLLGRTLPGLVFTRFNASGFRKPVCGLIHSKNKPATCGMPLGCVSTGCLDFGTDSTFGYCSVFNSIQSPREPLRLPFLGLHQREGTRTSALTTQKMEGIENARENHYWSHYPVAGPIFETSAPVSVSLRACPPFILGDRAISKAPAAVLEVRLRDKSLSALQGTTIFAFPGPRK
jgi:hypothetical protein